MSKYRGIGMAAGDGPRDWKQDDAYTFPYASGGIYRQPISGGASTSRPSGRPRVWLFVFGSVVVVLATVVLATHFGGLLPASVFNRPVSAAAPADGSAPATYPTRAAEHASLLHSAQSVATSLTALGAAGTPLPTSFVLEPDGVLLGLPGGHWLGAMDSNASIEWALDSSGHVTTLTLIGPTFGTRVSLDVGAIVPQRPSGTTA